MGISESLKKDTLDHKMYIFRLLFYTPLNILLYACASKSQDIYDILIAL